MNANRMISLVIRMIMRRLMRHGVKTGVGGNGPDGQKTAQRARRTMRAGRKIGRF